MFDTDTVALISKAPALDGLDLKNLPQQLTNAFATIVSTRIRIRDAGNNTGAFPDEFYDSIVEMKRLAFSHEAFVSVLEDRENRASAAFVAGAAHHVTLLAEKLITTSPQPSSLSIQGIPPVVSATLLFLIAEANADAAEMAKSINISADNTLYAAILEAILYLGKGELTKILALAIPAPESFLDTTPSEQAVRALYFMLLRGIRTLAASMLGLRLSIPDEELPEVIFRRVKELCIEPLDGINDAQTRSLHSLYPGPLHLASLLTAVSKDLSSSALINVPPPNGVDGQRWSETMQKIAESRPYLWRNHRQAIEAGYLEPGVSAAISFPTGAGKSTLSELKIATVLLRGAKVVFLAPTLALVDQTAKALSSTFPSAEVLKERAEEQIFDLDDQALPAISVMTPERCLSILSFDQELFADVELLVFDECHLLHPRDAENSRRAVDAMLCILNFTAVSPNSDLLLLSAMMMNCEEMSGWVSELTRRPCLPLSLTWKPTRQVRGCVVYGEEEVNRLNTRLRKARSTESTVNPPARLKRELNVQPFGFFCLHQTWQSNARKDYSLLPLLDETVTLSTGTARNGNWYLTPNGNKVASAIAASTARQQLKTLVFTQTIPLADSASKSISDSLGEVDCALTEEELRLYSMAVEECGGDNRVYLRVDSNGALISSAACHHGHLLPVERQLHESLFKRPDGINVLVATSTLAQGMNLPSEVVIIGGDSRFDPSANRMEQLEAHELLNAAGRAGRAGEASYGFVLVIPSKVVHFNNQNSSIHNHWSDLKAIFSQSDQCLTIDDPLTPLLDEIHNHATDLSVAAKYLLQRLPIGDPKDDGGSDSVAQNLLNRSLAAYQARKKGEQDWIDTRIDAALNTRNADYEITETHTWADRLAAVVGVPTLIIRELGEAFVDPINYEYSLGDWYKWLVDWLTARPHLIPLLMRKESLESLLGANYKRLEKDSERGLYAITSLTKLLENWMSGCTLEELERIYGTKEKNIGYCKHAREFVLRSVPELAYVFSLPGQVFRAVRSDIGMPTDPPLSMSLLGSCVKEGFDQAEKFALFQIKGKRKSRRQTHQKYELIERFIDEPAPGEDFGQLLNRVRRAIGSANQN